MLLGDWGLTLACLHTHLGVVVLVSLPKQCNVHITACQIRHLPPDAHMAASNKQHTGDMAGVVPAGVIAAAAAAAAYIWLLVLSCAPRHIRC